MSSPASPDGGRRGSGRLDRLHADVVAALQSRGATQRGDELIFKCVCPDHEDRNASASYNLEKRAHHCLGCGASGGLVVGDQPLAQLLGLDTRTVGNGGQPRRTYAWEIRDADGELVAVHHRKDLHGGDKRVWWTGPAGSKGLGGRKVVDLPLYGAHLLGEREPGDDSPVIVCEGEKATDAVLALGLDAVGTVTGASSTPSPDVFEILRDRRVVLWPDSDDQGRKHMQRNAGQLQDVAAGLRLFAPDLPPGGDAVEWIQENGADPAKLLAAVEKQAQEIDAGERPAPTDEARFELSHDGLALDLGELWQDHARYVDAWGRWLFWGGFCWEEDRQLLHMTRSREFLRDTAQELEEWAEAEAAELSPKEAGRLKCWAERQAESLRSARTVAQVVDLARSNPAQAASVRQWDADPFRVATPTEGER